ncbi:MAG: hypothetical protein GC190_14900 [Alphaproteobacteria bacterium]|nr:hypothetical protein [Alphaproteobacteria bacterium]
MLRSSQISECRFLELEAIAATIEFGRFDYAGGEQVALLLGGRLIGEVVAGLVKDIDHPAGAREVEFRKLIMDSVRH